MTLPDKKSANPHNCDSVSDETILKISKEIAVKFIEVGRITPTTFSTVFTDIYKTINTTIRSNKL